MKHKITDLDNNQIARYAFDEEHQANRVVIAGGDFGIAEAVKSGLGNININANVDMSGVIEKLDMLTLPEWPSTVREQQIIKETEVKIIRVPEYLVKTEVRTIEVPQIIIQKEVQVVEIPSAQSPRVIPQNDLFIKLFLIINSLSTLGLLALNLFKR